MLFGGVMGRRHVIGMNPSCSHAVSSLLAAYAWRSRFTLESRERSKSQADLDLRGKQVENPQYSFGRCKYVLQRHYVALAIHGLGSHVVPVIIYPWAGSQIFEITRLSQRSNSMWIRRLS